MADDNSGTPHFPDENEGPSPAPRRRAAPRKAPTRKPKSPVARSEESAPRSGTAAKVAVAEAGERPPRAVKPRSTSRAAPARAATRDTRAPAAEAAKKPAKRTPTSKTAAKRSPAKSKSTLDKATDRIGGRWAAAALAGVAAAGATAAAMLTLRGSSARNLGTTKKPIDISGSGDKGQGHGVDVHGTAHQPDGTDSSASFQAGIADENTVPDQV